jgi:hypothetical protein
MRVLRDAFGCNDSDRADKRYSKQQDAETSDSAQSFVSNGKEWQQRILFGNDC